MLPGEQPIARLPAHGVGLARQQCFIHFEEMSLEHVAVGDDGVAARSRMQSPRTTSLAGISLHLPVANDADLALVEDGELVELPLGTPLLEQADQRVDECRAADGNAGLPFVVVEEGDRGRHHDEVEQREEMPRRDRGVIRPADDRVRLTRPLSVRVRDFRGGQARAGCLRHAGSWFNTDESWENEECSIYPLGIPPISSPFCSLYELDGLKHCSGVSRETHHD